MLRVPDSPLGGPDLGPVPAVGLEVDVAEYDRLTEMPHRLLDERLHEVDPQRMAPSLSSTPKWILPIWSAAHMSAVGSFASQPDTVGSGICGTAGAPPCLHNACNASS